MELAPQGTVLETAAMRAVVHGPGEGERYPLGAGEVVIEAGEDDTGATMYLAEMIVPPGFEGPPPHRHARLHDIGRIASR